MADTRSVSYKPIKAMNSVELAQVMEETEDPHEYGMAVRRYNKLSRRDGRRVRKVRHRRR